MEIFLSVAIFTVLALSIFGVMDVGRNASFMGDSSVGTRQQIIRAFMTMEKELRETRPSQTSLTIGSTSANLTFKIPVLVNGSVLDSNGNIVWSNSTVYALNNAGQITRTVSGVTTILANNVSSLQFSRPVTPVNLIQVDITARKTSLSRRTVQDTGEIQIEMSN